MQITFETPKPAANALDETDALAQALYEVAVLHQALKELVPLDRQHPLPENATHFFGFDYTPDGRLESITATARPEKLNS